MSQYGVDGAAGSAAAPAAPEPGADVAAARTTTSGAVAGGGSQAQWRDLDMVSPHANATPASYLPPQGAPCSFVFEPVTGGRDVLYGRSTSPHAPARGGSGGGAAPTAHHV